LASNDSTRLQNLANSSQSPYLVFAALKGLNLA
jgi:hypothetical protein